MSKIVIINNSKLCDSEVVSLAAEIVGIVWANSQYEFTAEFPLSNVEIKALIMFDKYEFVVGDI